MNECIKAGNQYQSSDIDLDEGASTSNKPDALFTTLGAVMVMVIIERHQENID